MWRRRANHRGVAPRRDPSARRRRAPPRAPWPRPHDDREDPTRMGLYSGPRGVGVGKTLTVHQDHILVVWVAMDCGHEVWARVLWAKLDAAERAGLAMPPLYEGLP